MANGKGNQDWIDKHSGSLINGILLAAILGITASSINQTAMISVHEKQLDVLETRQSELMKSISDRTANRFDKFDGDRIRDEVDKLRDQMFEHRY